MITPVHLINDKSFKNPHLHDSPSSVGPKTPFSALYDVRPIAPNLPSASRLVTTPHQKTLIIGHVAVLTTIYIRLRRVSTYLPHLSISCSLSSTSNSTPPDSAIIDIRTRSSQCHPHRRACLPPCQRCRTTSLSLQRSVSSHQPPRLSEPHPLASPALTVSVSLAHRNPATNTRTAHHHAPHLPLLHLLPLPRRHLQDLAPRPSPARTHAARPHRPARPSLSVPAAAAVPGCAAAGESAGAAEGRGGGGGVGVAYETAQDAEDGGYGGF